MGTFKITQLLWFFIFRIDNFLLYWWDRATRNLLNYLRWLSERFLFDITSHLPYLIPLISTCLIDELFACVLSKLFGHIFIRCLRRSITFHLNIGSRDSLELTHSSWRPRGELVLLCLTLHRRHYLIPKLIHSLFALNPFIWYFILDYIVLIVDILNKLKKRQFSSDVK